MPHMEPAHQILCAVLTDARTRAGLTQRELAARMKRLQSFVGKIESGSRHINLLEFIQVARALEIEPAKLLKVVLEVTNL